MKLKGIMTTTNYKISEGKREMFYTEWHALLTAGLDFSHTFRLLIECEQDARLKRLLESLYEKIIEGASLWQAMKLSGAFKPMEYGVIRIGDETGRLAETLDFLSVYFHKKEQQRRLISSAVSYPIIILITAVAVVTFMLAVVVPMFSEVYARMGGELPALTQQIVSLSRSFPAYALVATVLFSVCGIYCHINRSKMSVRRWRARLMLGCPMMGTILRKSQESQFCRLLHLLSSSGVPLLSSVGMLRGVMTFLPYEESFEQIQRMLEEGKPFYKGLACFPKLYDRKLVTLIQVGEETNRLPEMLQKQGDALTSELEYAIRRMGALLEPMLIVFVGLLVAIILIAMYMPMFSLGGIIG